MRSEKRSSRFLVLALAAARLGAQSVLTAGTKTPFKLTRTLGGNFLLAEGGTGANDGKVTLVSLWGNRYNLLSGLPSGVTPEGAALGPTGVADAHGTLYITIGEGDARIESTQAPQQLPNPEGPSAPIFSSLLRARFTPVPDGIRAGFELTSDDIASLTDGNEITLHNDSGESVSLLVLTDFRDFVRDPILIFRQSNPFGAAVVGSLTEDDLTELGYTGTLDEANFAAGLDPTSPLGARLEQRTTVYVADAGMNTIVQVAASTGQAEGPHALCARPEPALSERRRSRQRSGPDERLRPGRRDTARDDPRRFPVCARDVLGVERGPGDGRRDAMDPGPDAGDQRARGRRRNLRSRGLDRPARRRAGPAAALRLADRDAGGGGGRTDRPDGARVRPASQRADRQRDLHGPREADRSDSVAFRIGSGAASDRAAAPPPVAPRG